jgi:hypothetical protein
MTDVLKLLARPLWWERAACRGRSDLLPLFVTSTNDAGSKRRRPQQVPDIIVRLCSHCPVARECLEEGLRFDAKRVTGHPPDNSIRAGLTAPQRRKLLARPQVHSA